MIEESVQEVLVESPGPVKEEQKPEDDAYKQILINMMNDPNINK